MLCYTTCKHAASVPTFTLFSVNTPDGGVVYNNLGPKTLYREYEASIAESVRDRKLVAHATLGARLPLRPQYAQPHGRLSSWWHAWSQRFVQSLQPAEEGYIA